MPTETADWLAFKAAQDNPAIPPCPFCGIRHTPGTTHPYCDMGARFRHWRTRHEPRIATADDRATVARLITEIGADRVAQYLADLDPAPPAPPASSPAASDPPRLAKAARALLDWAREHTSPRDPNSPHALLVALADALGPEATP